MALTTTGGVVAQTEGRMDERDTIEVPLLALAEEVRLLTQLLADPHPGLFTWCGMVAARIDRMYAMGHGTTTSSITR